MPSDRLPAGFVALHTCGGRDRLWLPAAKLCDARCRCGAPLAADGEYLPSHANWPCKVCQRVIGICGSPLLDQVEDWALQALREVR